MGPHGARVRRRRAARRCVPGDAAADRRDVRAAVVHGRAAPHRARRRVLGADASAVDDADAHADADKATGPAALGQVLMDPATLAQFLAGLGTAVNPNLTQPAPVPDALEAGLRGQQLRLAPGMTAEGPLLKQTLQQGQHTAVQIPMQLGKCYVVLGFSQPGGVKDLDLYLLAPPFYNLLTAQDATSHNAPYLGADAAVPPRPMCPVWPVPLQYKLEVFAKDGSGVVAVQVYSRASQ